MPFDPIQRERIRDDLQEVVRGEVLFDDLHCGLYSTDASIFQIAPLGAVAPIDADDVQAVVRYCAENKVPLIARGAGTGLAGETLGDGLIVDLSRHLRGIRDITAGKGRGAPGVVLQTLNAELAKVGRRFAPDPASGASCTMGGMLATNASGSRCLKYGYTRDHISRRRVVLDNGDAAEVGREPVAPPADYPARLADILRGTAALLGENERLIRLQRPATPFNRCGYALDGVLNEDSVDLPRLLVGTEGTLALFTEATLKTIPLPGGRSGALLGFADLDAALKAARLVIGDGPAACELLDRRLISLVRSTDPEAARSLPLTIECALLIEFEADRPTEARRL